MAETWVYLMRNAEAKLTENLGHEPERAELKMLLGGKGAGLVKMIASGAPVPPGFTITTEACIQYSKTGEFPKGMWEQAIDAIEDLEAQTGKTFGTGPYPLLVIVASSPRVSMPGMMDAVLNLGLNDNTRAAMAALTRNEWFSYHTYHRFITMFSDIVMGYSRLHFEDKLVELKQREGVELDREVSLAGLKWLVAEYKQMYKAKFGEEFPTDPYTQLQMTIKALFDSWDSERAVLYRERQAIPHAWGTTANVVTMVFGNMTEDSAVVDAFSRHPTTGEPQRLYGEWLPNAQFEDLFYSAHPSPYRVSLQGARAWAALYDISEEERKNKYPSLEEAMPAVYQEIVEIVHKLEHHYKDMQDVLFTIERGKVWLVQSRTCKRSAHAAIRVAVDLANAGLITRKEAVMRIAPHQLEVVLHPSFDPEFKKTLIAKGVNASPGAAVGSAVFDARRAKEKADQGEDVILVRPATVPDEVPGILASQGLITQQGHATSNVAFMALGCNLPAIVGCNAIVFDENESQFTAGDITVREGDTISIDGLRGEIYLGAVPLIEEGLVQEHLNALLDWADEIRDLGIRANADLGPDARQAMEFGAEGIGLARTEHMFFAEHARDAVVHMLIAKTDEEREAALNEMLPLHEQDFEGLFEAADGRPVAMRLLDPPLHEFLPDREELVAAVATLRCEAPDSKELAEKEQLLEIVNGMWEVNPMLGFRGCRAGILYPGLTEMQSRAYFQAACRCAKRGLAVHPEVMIPLVGHVNELKLEREKLEAVARDVMEEEGIDVPASFGVMIEVPRAALTSGEIAEYADFFSFGTNDLTQMTYGFSRDDAEGKFLLQYVKQGILPENPFQELDRQGVGRLVEMSIKEGKAANPDLEIGICGEHGGDPQSIDFCYRAGLDYVSCSRFRIPVARLAAAHATLNYRK